MLLLYKAGRFLQLGGLLLMPVGLAGNLADPARVDVKASLMIAGAGVALFLVGWMLQQAGRPN